MTLTKPTAKVTPLVYPEALDRVKRAAAGDNSRPALTSVYVIPGRTKETLVATDTHRLHVATSTRGSCLNKPGYVAISKHSCAAPESAFPNWERVVPAKYTKRFWVNGQALRKAVVAAGALAKDSANRVVLEFTKQPKGNGFDIAIVTKSQEFEEIEIKATLKTWQFKGVKSKSDDDSFRIGFNFQYLVDALPRSVKDTMAPIALEFTEPSRPAVIRWDDGFYAVIMPMALGN